MNPVVPSYVKTIPQDFLQAFCMNEKAKRAFNKFTSEIALDLEEPKCVHFIKDALYEGDLKDGQPDGFGRKCSATGEFYEGCWKQGKYHGHGVYVDLSEEPEESFVGEWDKGAIKRGIYRFANGAFYSGEWANQKKHGYGVYRTESGKNKAGYWENGELVKEIKLITTFSGPI